MLAVLLVIDTIIKYFVGLIIFRLQKDLDLDVYGRRSSSPLEPVYMGLGYNKMSTTNFRL